MISTKGRYALRLMIDVAGNAGTEGLVTMRQAAERQGISVKYLEQLGGALVRAGVLVSLRGVRGGYQLARPASEITLRQVLEAVEGPYIISRCQRDGSCCEQTASCRFSAIYAEIAALVRDKLDGYTFASICFPSKSDAP